MNALNRLIDEKMQRLETLKKPGAGTSLDGRALVCVVFSVLLLASGIGGCVVDNESGAWGGWSWLSWIGVFMLLLGAIFGAQTQVAAEQNAVSEVQQLEQEIATLQKQLHTSEELSTVETELATLSPDRFGCQTTGELRKLLHARRELIQRIMGGGAGAVATPARCLPAATTDKVIGYIPEVTPPTGIVVEEDEDQLRLWCIATAKLQDAREDAVWLATKSPFDYLELMVQHHGAVVINFTHGTLELLCQELKAKLPREFLESLINCGITAHTELSWYPDCKTPNLASEPSESWKSKGKRLTAGEAFVCLPT